MRKLRFGDLSCGDAACADFDSLDGAVEVDLDFLEVGKETTQRLSDDLRTGAARSFDLTAPLIFYAGNDPFSAYCAYVGHDFLLLNRIHADVPRFCLR